MRFRARTTKIQRGGGGRVLLVGRGHTTFVLAAVTSIPLSPSLVTDTDTDTDTKENTLTWYGPRASDPEGTFRDTKEAYKMPITKDITTKLQTLWSQWYDKYVGGVDFMEDWDVARIKKIAPKEECASLKTLVKKKEDAMMNI